MSQLIFSSKAKTLLLISIASILLFSSCENLSDPGQPEYNYSLFFNLKANSDKQKFYIYNIAPLDEYQSGYLPEFDKYFVTDAEIQIESDGIIYSDFFVETDSQGVRYFTNNNIVIYPGIEYHLNVVIAEDIITGTTFVPSDFELTYPAENQTIHFINNKLEVDYTWTKSSNSFGYLLNVLYPFLYNGTPFNDNYILDQTVFDTTYFFDSIFEPVDTVYTTIAAFDGNYYNHLFEGKASSGIEGAYGYFGSSVYKRLKFIIR